MDITGNALVIGGGSGIGRACAILLAREGASGVLIGDLDIDTATAAVNECHDVASNSSFRAEAFHVDVAREESVRNIFARMVDAFGRIDYCINCAGIGVTEPADIAALSLSEFQRFLNINSTGSFLVTREASLAMRAQKLRPVMECAPGRGLTRGSIVLLSSANAMIATKGVLPYTVSKHATLGLTKNSALDNAEFGIRVNCVCPSWTDTPMVRKAVDGVDGLEDLIKSKLPIGRMALSAEIADTVVFLLSPRASFVTGSAMVVDGGLLMGT